MEKQQKKVSEFIIMARIERELNKLQTDHERTRVINWMLSKRDEVVAPSVNSQMGQTGVSNQAFS